MKENHDMEASRWLKQALHDFEVAKKHYRDEYWSDCCFLAQQAAEKALKGYLFYRGRRPGTYEVFTHSINELVKHCRRLDNRFPVIPRAKDLDKFYIPTRYPDAFPGDVPYEMYEKKDGDLAIEIASGILSDIKKRMRR